MYMVYSIQETASNIRIQIWIWRKWNTNQVKEWKVFEIVGSIVYTCYYVFNQDPLAKNTRYRIEIDYLNWDIAGKPKNNGILHATGVTPETLHTTPYTAQL